MSKENIDNSKSIYLIVHGQRAMLEPVKQKLQEKGFSRERMQPATLEKAGESGEYVAMLWPPMGPKEIVVSLITGKAEGGHAGPGMGAWSTVNQKEIYRISLA